MWESGRLGCIRKMRRRANPSGWPLQQITVGSYGWLCMSVLTTSQTDPELEL
jgi:hypothetical protein